MTTQYHIARINRDSKLARKLCDRYPNWPEIREKLKEKYAKNKYLIDKVLKSAVANADELQGDVDLLYISQARVDDAGVRVGTKRWIPKDRGRAHPISKKACHIHITVTQA